MSIMERKKAAHALRGKLLEELKSCTIRKDLLSGKRVHDKAVESQNESNIYVATALIKMYAKCGSTLDARRVFDNIEKPDLMAWTALIMGYAENGEGQDALELFSRRGYIPDSVTYVAVLKACTSLAVKGAKKRCLQQGREIHSEIGCRLTPYVQSSLIDMYAKCGSMDDARRVFDSMENPDVVCWNTLLLGYADNGEGNVALELFARMKARGLVPSTVTYIAAVKACTGLAVEGAANCLAQGREIHSEIGSKLNHQLDGALIVMYAKCKRMSDARRILERMHKPDLVTWTSMVQGYAENGEGDAALEAFARMKACRCAPDSMAYVAALQACTTLALSGDDLGKERCLKLGRKIHSSIGCHMNEYVQTTLIDMYAKGGNMSYALRVFEDIQKPDVVSWTAMLMGYAENDEGHAAIDLFTMMRANGCTPDFRTYIAVLKACSLLGALALGRKLHSEITEFPSPLVTCLVDFYAKCGSMKEAREVFDLNSKSIMVPTWNALLSGYGSFGDVDSMFNTFDAMQDEGCTPVSITFVCILLCCSHAGLVEKARFYLDAMCVRYGVSPNVMHYTCMVDVLGRANRLNEAIEVIKKMPCKPDAVAWRTLLGASKKWKNIEIGRMAFQALAHLNKKDASVYVLMADTYDTSFVCEEQGIGLIKRYKPACS